MKIDVKHTPLTRQDRLYNQLCEEINQLEQDYDALERRYEQLNRNYVKLQDETLMDSQRTTVAILGLSMKGLLKPTPAQAG